MCKQCYIKYHLMFFFVLFQYIYAQNSWKVQNPLPTESNLLAVEPVTEKKVFAGGLGGTILKTTNAGETWVVKKFNI